MVYKKILLVLLISVTSSSFAEGITVKHLAPKEKVLKNPPYKYMWYYRTEVRNTGKSPLRIIWFQAFFKENGQWYGANALGRTLRAKVFSNWYTEGDKIINGVIRPGEVAICDVNWFGNSSGKYMPIKWGYTAVDKQGRDYYIEAEVKRSVTKKQKGKILNMSN